MDEFPYDRNILSAQRYYVGPNSSFLTVETLTHESPCNFNTPRQQTGVCNTTVTIQTRLKAYPVVERNVPHSNKAGDSPQQ